MTAFEIFDACAEGKHAECSFERVCTSVRRGGELEVQICACPCNHNPDGSGPVDVEDLELGEAGA